MGANVANSGELAEFHTHAVTCSFNLCGNGSHLSSRIKTKAKQQTL